MNSSAQNIELRAHCTFTISNSFNLGVCVCAEPNNLVSKRVCHRLSKYSEIHSIDFWPVRRGGGGGITQDPDGKGKRVAENNNDNKGLWLNQSTQLANPVIPVTHISASLTSRDVEIGFRNFESLISR